MKIQPLKTKKDTRVYYYSPKEYDAASRYAYTNRLHDKYNGCYYHSTFNRFEFGINASSAYYKVTEKTENRIDLISKEAYNTTSYWSAICLANDIIDPFNIPKGTILLIPDIATIQSKRGLF